MDLILNGLNENTPLELYNIKGRDVWVKRDDLLGDGTILPPWGKMAAVYQLVKKYVDKNKPLTHLSVDGSWTAWVLAAICDNLGIEFYASYPDSKKISQEYLSMIGELFPKTKFNPVRPNMMKIMYNSLKLQANKNNWQMLPYAFDHDYYKDSLKERIKQYNDFDNLVVSSGSGVTLAGLVKGFYGDEVVNGFFEKSNKKVWTTCVSSVDSISRKLKSSGIHLPINIRKSEYDFNDRLDGYSAPFPCNQFWDIKQWKWLEENIDTLDGSILFWNIGGIYKF